MYNFMGNGYAFFNLACIIIMHVKIKIDFDLF